MKKRSIIVNIIILGLCVLIIMSGCSNEIKSTNLMAGFVSVNVNEKELDNKFINSTAEFSFELFKNLYADDENTVISPTSILLALAMVANGAKGETLSEMENVLGGGMSINELNEYLYSYVCSLPNIKKSTLNINNSIWVKQNYIKIKKEFLQVNANYYNASAYESAFDEQTLKDINNWVKQKTDGMIDKILEQIGDNVFMYLINTILFNAEWENKYDNISDGEFKAFNNSKKTVKYLNSTESKYITTDNATGFIRPYYNNKYSFVALLPNENISIDEYVSSINGKDFIDIINNTSNESVKASMPKFEYEFKVDCNDALIAMGIKSGFDASKADFSNMAVEEGIFINQVLHKAKIILDEKGTKASAVTVVGIAPVSVTIDILREVILNRPFVYAIVDNVTNLPIFIGTFINP